MIGPLKGNASVSEVLAACGQLQAFKTFAPPDPSGPRQFGNIAIFEPIANTQLATILGNAEDTQEGPYEG